MHSIHLLWDRFCATTKGTANRKRQGVLIQCNTVVEAWTVCVDTHWWHTNPDLSKDTVWEGFHIEVTSDLNVEGTSQSWADMEVRGAGKTRTWRYKKRAEQFQGLQCQYCAGVRREEELDGCRGPMGHLMWVASQTKPWEQRELLKAPFHADQIYLGFTGDVERLMFASVCVHMWSTLFGQALSLVKDNSRYLRCREPMHSAMLLQHPLQSHSTLGWMYCQGLFPSPLVCEQRCCLVGQRASERRAKLPWPTFPYMPQDLTAVLHPNISHRLPQTLSLKF